ncbi:hypothetical protein ATDW_26040 [Asticcacaulis sp. DW145]|uniref:hypothetical protein n=1 Tax=Asticcacaulis sp. DW145 TaxID=3095608 RepID=UPI0030851D2A|nr:hypothetical protein ATDW_26040 [Asticcacaulis sp. DW145]
MTALIICAGLSVICVAILALAQQDRKRAERELVQVEMDIAMDEALLRTAADIMASEGEPILSRDYTLGQRDVHVAAENEAFKWPLDKVAEISEVTLAHRTKAISVGELKAAKEGRVETRFRWPVNDCFRQLASPFGFAPTDKDRPSNSTMFMTSAKDGQVWRMRVVLGPRVREQLIRLTGDPTRPFAVILDDVYSVGEMPSCFLS